MVARAQMEKGKECGILLAECPDLQQGDIIQCVEVVKKQRTLEESGATASKQQQQQQAQAPTVDQIA